MESLHPGARGADLRQRVRSDKNLKQTVGSPTQAPRDALKWKIAKDSQSKIIKKNVFKNKNQNKTNIKQNNQINKQNYTNTETQDT